MPRREIKEMTALPLAGLVIFESNDVENFAPYATLAPMRERDALFTRVWYRFDGAMEFFANDAEAMAWLKRNYGQYVAVEREG